MIRETLIRKQRLERACPAAEAERINGKHRHVGCDLIATIAGRLIFAMHRFAHDHPQRVASRRAVAGGQHELIRIWMLRPAVIKTETTLLWPGEMGDDIERGIGERSTEVSCLRIIAE